MRSLLLILTIFSSHFIRSGLPALIGSASSSVSSSLSSSTSPIPRSSTTPLTTSNAISPETPTSSSLPQLPQATPPAKLEPFAECMWHRTVWPRYDLYIYNITNWTTEPDADGDGNDRNIIAKLLNEMLPCLARLVWYHFPDKDSGLGGLIVFEVSVFFTPGWFCASRAIAAAGGPKMHCAPGAGGPAHG